MTSGHILFFFLISLLILTQSYHHANILIGNYFIFMIINVHFMIVDCQRVDQSGDQLLRGSGFGDDR